MTAGVSYRSIDAGDMPMLLDWRNSRDVAKHMYSDHVITADEHRAWFDAGQGRPDLRRWIIALDGRPVGLVSVAEICFDKKDAVWAFYLADPATRGQGVGLLTEYCVLALAFDHWALDALRCEVLETNGAARALHESVGFAPVGRLVGRAVKAGTPVDAIAYRMARPDWLATCKARLETRLRDKGVAPRPLAREDGGAAYGPTTFTTATCDVLS